jgi:hypothetical protein
MAALKPANPWDLMTAVQPRTGFPVQNMGGISQTPSSTPLRNFMVQPTIARGQPGPNAGRLPTTTPPFQQPVGGVQIGAPAMPAGPYAPIGKTAPSAPPAPAPAAASPTAPSPAVQTPTATSTTTASSGQTGVLSQPAQGDLEQQIRDYISGAMSGSVTPEFIQRAKEQVFRNVRGQTSQASNRINEDAIRRGLYRSGIPAEGIANVEAAGQGAMASGIADILNAAEQQNIQGRQAAAGTAGNLLSANRSWQQYLDQKAAADAARAGANQPSTFTYIDPETGQSYEMDESWFS